MHLDAGARPRREEGVRQDDAPAVEGEMVAVVPPEKGKIGERFKYRNAPPLVEVHLLPSKSVCK